MTHRRPSPRADRAGPRGHRLGEIARRYSADAEAYRDLWAPALRPYGSRLIEQVPLAGAGRILDAASGTGMLLDGLRQAAPGAAILSADCSPGMLALAPAGSMRAVMDVRRLGLRDRVFDAALMAFALFHLPDPLEALVELRRVLRTGGAIGITTWDGDPCFAAHQVWVEELAAAGAAPAPVMSNHELVSRPSRMRRLLRRAGFTGIRSWTEPFAHRYGMDELMGARARLGGTRHQLESLDAAARQAALERIRRRLETMAPDDFTDRAAIVFSTALA